MNSQDAIEAISVERMRKSDAYTIANFVPSKELMYRAAMGIYSSVNWHGRVAVVCGSGNNAGDGYALACILADNGISSTLFRISDKFSDDGKYYYDMAMEKGVTERGDLDLDGYDFVVDCLLGTGFSGEPKGNYKEAINKINASNAYVISADINSGLNGDSGEGTIAVKSDLTVSIGYYKTGMFKGDAPSLIGKLVNVDIGIVLI